ncbi:sugar-binding domain-containing protein [Leucobacter sp. UT-8R-CII-1-4]|uniref:sugar-binding transcriptional regulator n=1 Tax=Leucobacter sp. UT-8R-CII-1-4 TaxID=3040075 RepID=UPI0024A7E9C5|nr:sugar-binding domain-containing protein [Leucobacter sp. UT-8R-CII-1-4]MDI6023821.1 sugar-binding domain-containing protein [Leucobacter sp. UT-8R-CII-1-4]
MNEPDRNEAMWAAANAYYLRGEKMEAIADSMRVSRSTVSRLLQDARDTGIVDIRVRSPFNEVARLEEALRERFGVHSHVAGVRADASEGERLDQVAQLAAEILAGLVSSHMTVGIAWGSTLAAISRKLSATHTADTVFVQLNGSGNMWTTGIAYASDILRRFGRAFTAQVQHFPVPAFFDNPATKTALWQERSTRRILDLQAKLDMIIFSVGAAQSPVPSHVYAEGYLENEDLQSLESERVVGDVATVFFREDGTSADIKLNARASGPSLHQLAHVKRRVCVAAGEGKAKALAGALAAGLVTDLVLDEAIARALLERSDPLRQAR